MNFFTLPGTVDGVFLPKPAEEILANKESNDVPLMIGVTEQEFGWVIPKLMNVSGLGEGMDRTTVESILQAFPYMNNAPGVLSLVMDEYIGDTSDLSEIRNRFLDLCGDAVFVMPALKTAKYHRGALNGIYNYEEKVYMWSRSPKKKLRLTDDPEGRFIILGKNSDDRNFGFDGWFLSARIGVNPLKDGEKKEMPHVITAFWYKISMNHHPSESGLVKWPSYQENEAYMQLDLEQKLSEKYKADKFVFWSETLPETILILSEEQREECEDL
ncbi:Hypothetical predicted protein [Pelobates cultripes]|uniref:Carboxylesterase type B domain-containing protein n=1 Tax=Pelobates cultripes TaxID=61616 RepID=A0AAD1WVM4_PELCU|nr:Hypothetical predicted protein [Pelobates cultripes]